MAKRDDVLRWAAPAAFLAAVTVAVLLVRAGLNHDAPATPQPSVNVPTVTAATPTATTTAVVTKSTTATTAATTYTIQSGDTYGSIAAKLGTTVAELQALNPGVDSNALSVGQKIRVK
jgi:peptidoglycan DL-endopeptidase LytF